MRRRRERKGIDWKNLTSIIGFIGALGVDTTSYKKITNKWYRNNLSFRRLKRLGGKLTL